ncbi:MAG: NAD(P)H-binding protein [Rhodospirillaceae bacterium]|nr:NAD(P)H-binding protein [Rhodospirillaceae bacterium]MBT5243498.1 NAD(P)H-binding protein [Rhodospirillaceae bacterium]MBT5562086.1 NAD(P)H-binding protein [Rhodospirillaceae bacterium]MBT6242259.1 NAD(P)H-binding protein [Rhodospirillaceae bacterium]MBT7136917.1 NAD(P)H-binding protein [Rhodospirillaceae bacterium]
MKNVTKRPILVLGGKGKTGRRVVERLHSRGREVRAVSRSTTPGFDWNDPETWADVLQGIGSVYITYQPDLAVPGAVETVKQFVEQAMAAGIARFVLLSGRGEEEAQRAEQVLQNSGADWTIVRAGWFAQNFSESFLMDGVLAGQVVLPALSTKEPFVDADDIADVVVETLLNDHHIGQLYEVTGSRLMTFADGLREISAACGRDIEFIEVSPDEYKELLIAHQLPEDMIWLIMYLFTTVLDGRNEHVNDGIQRALGRPPKDFTDYARDVAQTGAWAA